MLIDILSNLVIEKVHSVSTVYTPQNKKAKRNDRKRWAVVIKYEGETVYTANGKHFVSDANRLIILPKGCCYEWVCTKAGHFSIIEFESEQTFSEPISCPVKNSDKILKMFSFLDFRKKYFFGRSFIALSWVIALVILFFSIYIFSILLFS